MRARRRRVHVPPDLTSLFDVLFIVIFAALIRAAAAQQQATAAEAAAAPPPPAPPPPVLTPARCTRARWRRWGASSRRGRRSSCACRADGHVVALESGGKTSRSTCRCSSTVPDPDVAVAYLGDRAAELRLCRLVASHLQRRGSGGVPRDRRAGRALADLPHALFDGLHRDIDRCLRSSA